MSGIQLSIKMGSCFTSIYKQDEGIVLHEPTLIAYSGAGKTKEIKAVGIRAKRILGRTSENTKVVSPIFEGAIADIELASYLLKDFVRKVIPRSIVKPNIRAIVCVPLGLGENECKVFERVCYNAGINEAVLVPSVLCGAIGYNLNVESAIGRLVVNIGGGTTDIAVLSSNTIISGANVTIGGINVDAAINKIILEKFNMIVGEGVVERVKMEIGSLYSNDRSNTEISGVDAKTKLSKTDVISSGDIYDAIEYYYGKIATAIQSVVNSCPPEIVADISNEGMFVFGGGSLVTGADQFFRTKLGMVVTVEEETNAIDVIGAGKLLSSPRMLKSIMAGL